MLLSREFIGYLSRQLVARMTPQIIETTDPNLAIETISHIIEEELAVEDRLNDEVRELLSQYSEYMRREGVSYQDMFRRIKNTMISQRKVIRASGRDTGDNMKLSRDKINDISHKMVSAIRKTRAFRLKKDQNDVRLEIVKAMTELLAVEEKVDRAARTKIRTQKKEIPEGTEEWDLLHRRYYAEELKKFGIDLCAMTTIAVVGSLNMDFVVAVDRLPAPSETVLGRDFQMIPGGKGANQACAAAKIGGKSSIVRMVGRVGYDVFADHLRASLSAAGVDVSAVHATRSSPTGVALIWVEHSGQNSIVVASGANHALAASEVESMRNSFRGAQFVLFQLESPVGTVAAALRIAREEGARTILDPAPAQVLSAEMLAQVDVLTPNEAEASVLLGLPPGRVSVSEAPVLARSLHALGPRAVVLKLGDQGSFYLDDQAELHCAGFSVTARDTTAAGDVFNAGLAVALAEGRPVGEALRFANASAAISVTRVGAQASVPGRAEVDEFLASHPAL